MVRHTENHHERANIPLPFVVAGLHGVAAGRALVAVNSLVALPKPLLEFGNDASRWCLVAAIAAIGMKTQLRELATVGIKPVLLMIGETVFLAVLVLLLVRWAA